MTTYPVYHRVHKDLTITRLDAMPNGSSTHTVHRGEKTIGYLVLERRPGTGPIWYATPTTGQEARAYEFSGPAIQYLLDEDLIDEAEALFR